MKSTARDIFGPDALSACALGAVTVTASAVTLEREVSVPDGFTSRERLVEYGGKPYCVPEGKRLVIESVSGALEAPSDEKAFRICFRSDKNGAGGPKHFLCPRLVATAHGAADYYTILERQIHAVIEERESIVVAVSRIGFSGQADVQLTLTGYLLDKGIEPGHRGSFEGERRVEASNDASEAGGSVCPSLLPHPRE